MIPNADPCPDELALFHSLEETARRKGGRRGLPPDLRTDPFSLRLTAAEKEMVIRTAASLGFPKPASWARVALLEAARRLVAEIDQEP